MEEIGLLVFGLIVGGMIVNHRYKNEQNSQLTTPLAVDSHIYHSDLDDMHVAQNVKKFNDGGNAVFQIRTKPGADVYLETSNESHAHNKYRDATLKHTGNGYYEVDVHYNKADEGVSGGDGDFDDVNTSDNGRMVSLEAKYGSYKPNAINLVTLDNQSENAKYHENQLSTSEENREHYVQSELEKENDQRVSDNEAQTATLKTLNHDYVPIQDKLGAGVSKKTLSHINKFKFDGELIGKTYSSGDYMLTVRYGHQILNADIAKDELKKGIDKGSHVTVYGHGLDVDYQNHLGMGISMDGVDSVQIDD